MVCIQHYFSFRINNTIFFFYLSSYNVCIQYTERGSYYEDYIYYYKIVDIYDVPKTGSLKIKRNHEKTVMTLITCTKNSKTLQTVYILELFSKTRNGEVND